MLVRDEEDVRLDDAAVVALAERESVEVYSLGSDGYGLPVRYELGDTVCSTVLPGFTVTVDDAFKSPKRYLSWLSLFARRL